MRALARLHMLQLQALSSNYTDGSLRLAKPLSASNGFLFKMARPVPVSSFGLMQGGGSGWGDGQAAAPLPFVQPCLHAV